jgi:hypothetical protein
MHVVRGSVEREQVPVFDGEICEPLGAHEVAIVVSDVVLSFGWPDES